MSFHRVQFRLNTRNPRHKQVIDFLLSHQEESTTGALMVEAMILFIEQAHKKEAKLKKELAKNLALDLQRCASEKSEALNARADENNIKLNSYQTNKPLIKEVNKNNDLEINQNLKSLNNSLSQDINDENLKPESYFVKEKIHLSDKFSRFAHSLNFDDDG